MKVLPKTETSHPSQILLMEDELSVAQGVQMALEEEGYEVDLARTGKTALDKFHQKDFDLLMADLRLPDMDGMDVLRQARGMRPETAVIVITGYASVESAVAAMKLGAFDYLAKPFTADEMKASVNGVFKKKPTPKHPFPRKDRKAIQEEQIFNPLASERRPHILLMEDELSLANGLKMVLSEAGYEVDLTMTGTTALETISKNGFDLLLADLRLPDIDGLEVIKQVKEKKPDTAIIVITGYATAASAVDSMKLGAFDYLSKPFTEEDVKGAVESALKLKQETAVQTLLHQLDTEEGKLIQKNEILRVLDRTSQDEHFWRTLADQGSEALGSYVLSAEAKAAIVSGDLNWLSKHAGDLTDEQQQWIWSRLELERW